jgi:hypothetical protein
VDTLLVCLRLLRPLLKTILMSGEINSRLQEISESSSIFIPSLLIFNLVVASQDLPMSFQDEKPDDEVPMDSNPSKPYKFLLIIMFLTVSSGEGVNNWYPWSARLCRSFDLVTAWMLAWEILSDALNADFFADLQLYIYTPASPRQLLLPADHKLNQYLEDLRSPADRLHGPCLEMVLERNQGKLHTEAQLMAFLQGRPVSAAYQLWISSYHHSKTHEIHFGVSKKCCLCCWLFVGYLNEHFRNMELNQINDFYKISIHMHANVFPWIPPPDVDEAIWSSVLSQYIELQKNFQRSHSRPSSGAATDLVPNQILYW